MTSNANVSYLPGSQADANASETARSIQRVFERQRETALRLRSSTREERASKIRRLKQAVLDARPAFYE
ncbi:hypothetical protein NUK39_21865, partial [Aeromonas veronii]